MNIAETSRRLYDELARGWNTWDVQSVAAHVLLPDRLRLHVSFVVPGLSGYSENSLWSQVENFGEHSDDGRYSSVDIKYCGNVWRVESAARGEALVLRVTPLQLDKNAEAFIVLEVSEIWGGRLHISYDGGAIEADRHVIRALEPQAETNWDPVKAAHLIVRGDRAAYFTANLDCSIEEADQRIAEGLQDWMANTVHAKGRLEGGIAAMRRSLLWNMVYEPRNRRVVTPVSRNWCSRRGGHFGDYVLFDWDTFFAALQYALFSKDLAYAAFYSMLEEITPEGMIPNFGCANGQSRDRSEPQVGSLCAWKLYQQFGEREFIEEVFEPLLSWNRWRFRERDKNGDGLLELASTPFGTKEEMDAYARLFPMMDKQGAMYESGLDNSTMFDRAKFNEEHCCLEQSYVGLNALMVADCDLLAKMARLLERPSELEELEQRRDRLAALINSELWCEERGIYLNRNWDGSFDPTLSLTHFYPMLGGIVPNERQQRLMAHLLDENEFWGEYVVPNIARSDPSFQEQAYWRGRIWAPTNFLVGEGLLRMGEIEAWDELVRRGLGMFLDCWESKGVVGENYNAITGQSAETRGSDRFYHWGALLVYMAVQRVINFDQWNDTTTHRELPEWMGRVHNVLAGDGSLDTQGLRGPGKWQGQKDPAAAGVLRAPL